ncbi:MAG TPA: tripartite tricarboxylate transporter substrate binding protein [Burkholderiales bacterium]|nr:tripartite tricarboxylate transporter substrate binding protein [Burkholderiales bacterium]
MGSLVKTLALLLLLSGNALAQYPAKPIRWIVPFPPGGPTDTFSRPVAQKLSEIVGQPVIIENVGGAGGSLGVDRIAKSEPDGYTLGLATTGTQTINPHLYGKRLAYDALKDFTDLTLAVRYVNLLIVNPRVPAKSVAELVTYAKANPGKVTFGSAGNGSSNHLSGEVLKYVTGAPMTHVPYKGSAAALTDVIAGNITCMFDILVTALPQAHAGHVRALAVTSATRSPFAPDIPTMEESGIKGYSDAGADLWFGIIAPAGLPRPVTARLNGALVQALRSPDIRQRLSAQAFEPWTSTPEEFARVIRSDYEKWGRIVKASGARID